MFDINLLNEKNFLRLTQRLINNVLKKDKGYYINIRKKYDRYILRLLNGFYVDETLNLFYRRLDSDIILTDLIELKVALNFLYSIIGKKFKTVQVACLKQKNDEREMKEFFKQYFNYNIREIYNDGLFVKVENLTVQTSYGSTWLIEKFKIISFNKFKKKITKLLVDFNINHFYSKIDNIINLFKKDYIQNKFIKVYKEYRLKKIDKLLSKYLLYTDNHRIINEYKVQVIKNSEYIYNTIIYNINGRKISESDLDIRNEKDCETLMKIVFNYYTKDYFEY